MKIFVRLTVFALFVLALATGCKKENPGQTAAEMPVAAAQMQRNFYYPSTNTSNSAGYTSAGNSTFLKGCRFNDAGELVIYFEVPYPGGTDNTSFTVSPSKLKDGYAGEYMIKPGDNQGDGYVQYSYALSANSANIFLPGMAEGKLVIGSYDKRFKTISGNYNFFINSRQDPMAGRINNYTETKITVSGTFENLAVQGNRQVANTAGRFE